MASMDVVTLTGSMEDRDTWTAERCSVDAAIRLIGNRSAILILREAFYGTRRFDQFARRVGVSEPVAAAHLKELVAQGLLERSPYREPGQRTRYDYGLTAKGRDLFTSLVALMQWGDTWLAPDDGPVRLDHRGCGEPLAAEVRCRAGHLVGPDETSASRRSG